MVKKKITLYAQPRDDFPYLKKSALKDREYEEYDGLFGTIPFTDIGEESWHSIKSMYQDAVIKLVKSGIGSVPWTILVYSEPLRIALTCQQYTKEKGPKGWLVKLQLRGEDGPMRRFLRRLVSALKKKPWVMTDWDDFEEFTSEGKKDHINLWKKLTTKETLVKKEKMPEKVDASSKVEYHEAHVLYRVEVTNLRSKTIKSLKISLEVPEEELEADSKEQGAPSLNSGATYVARFRLKPKGFIEDAPVMSVVRYLLGEKKKKKSLEPQKVTVKPPEFKPETIDEATFDERMMRYHKQEEATDMMRRPAADLFDELVDGLDGLPMNLLDVSVDRKGGVYTGTAKLYAVGGRGVEGQGFGLVLVVQGDGRESKVRMRIHSSKIESLAGFKQVLVGSEPLKKFFGTYE
jgi:hypothetical protein